jgi:NAD+ kinase
MMQRVGLVLKEDDKNALSLAEDISAYLLTQGKETLLEPSCAPIADQLRARISPHLADEADLLVVLGGDGTILHAVSLLNSKPVPVLGVNLGRVGFIAEVSPNEALSELQSALEGASRLVRRMMLQVTLPDGAVSRVLNDVVIHWGRRARLIELGVKIGSSREIEVRADGLIVSTPVGSSAYSIAANGPLVHPDLEATLLTPICPYSGLKRPLLTPPHLKVEIFLRGGEDLTLTLDGRAFFSVEKGQTLTIERSAMPFTLIKGKARDYFEVLKEKLGLL